MISLKRYASSFSRYYEPAAPPRVDRDSKTSTRGTAYINIWDSTSGYNANALVNRRVMIGGEY